MSKNASFAPVVMTASGGFGRSATSLYKRIASLLADRRNEPYSHVMAFVRCRISFVLLRSCIVCLRGSRTLFGKYQQRMDQQEPPATLAVSEAAIAV